MATRIFDELKQIKQDVDESAIRKSIIDYFDEMDVDDVDKRTETAISLEKVVRNILLLALAGEMAREQLIDRLISEYSMIILESGYRPNYAHIERVCEDIVDNTLAKIDVEYMTSAERSIVIAETETNNAANYDGYEEAKEDGKTQKVWKTIGDNRVRATHQAIADMVVGIDDFFHVGNAEMLYPCDEENAYDHPEEIVSCRCWLEFQ